MPASDSGRPSDRRLLHHHETVTLKVVDQALCHDLRHDLIRVMLPLAALEPEREGELSRQVLGRGQRKASEGAEERAAMS
jgi:hypothetical protein